MCLLYIYFTLSVFLTDIVVSALSVTSTPEVIVVNGGSATFRISYVMGSGETFSQITFKRPRLRLFDAPVNVPPNITHWNGSFLGAYKTRGSTDYSHGKTNFTITLSQVTPDDEGNYTVVVRPVNGVEKSSISKLVVDKIVTPTGKAGETVTPTGKTGETVTATGKAGVSAGCDDIPNKIILEAAFVVIAMVSTVF